MSRHLSLLQQAIQSSISPQNTGTDTGTLAEFPKLKDANEYLYRLFESAKSEPVPPLEKRRAALARFNSQNPLSRQEWRMVLSGLSDKAIDDIQVLDNASLFSRVVAQLHEQMQNDMFRRREWFSLCFSYFSFSDENPHANPQWLSLRQQIINGYDVICRQQAREKEWMKVVNSHKELFTDSAGNELGNQLFNGQIKDLEHLQVIAQIPDGSWLWSKIMVYVCQRIETLKDDELQQHLPSLIDIGKSYPLYRDRIFAACLTRYSQTRFRDIPHIPLKTAAFEAWGSPQLRSKNNVWRHHVEEPVSRMVMGWFARQDLEHFFSLLQGTAQVDRTRLEYWLRFVNQMSYTRIVLGTDARTNRGTDFVEFRKANIGRLAYLDGGTSADNAVVMQIGNYFFVEFSKVGNACYVHKANSRFNPEQPTLHLRRVLKDTNPDVFVEKYNHSGPWQIGFDQELSRLGIRPDTAAASVAPGKPARTVPEKHIPSPRPLIHHFPAPPSSRPATASDVRIEEDFMIELRETLKSVIHNIQDNRVKGGGLHVTLTGQDDKITAALKRLGFKSTDQNPFWFWRN